MIKLNVTSTKIIAGSLTFLTLSYGLVRLYFIRKRNKKKQAYPKDVVILHRLPPHAKIPNISPLCMKLETWLRMADIKYKTEFTFIESSSKKKLPFITFNGKEMDDSFFIISFLAKKFGKDLSTHLTHTQKAVARAMLKLTEESLNWIMLYYRVKKENSSAKLEIPALIFPFVKHYWRKALNMQGYGRHSDEEILQIGKDDLKALEDFIAAKKFLFGETPCVEDSVIFAQTCQFVYVDQGPLNKYVTNECPNLMRHMLNIKEIYWNDWDLCLRK